VGKKQRRGEEERRFEELDSEDEDDGQGVGLEPGFQQKRFPSDELRFTGLDFSSRAYEREHNNNDEDSDYSDEDHVEDEQDDGRGPSMQVALRDKEDYLVQTAIERIRRARMLGKTNVGLTQEEMNALDAFERKRQQQQKNSSKSKDKKSGWSRPKPEEKRKSKDRASDNPPKTVEPSRRSRGRTSGGTSPEESTPPYPLLPYPDYPEAGTGPSSPSLGYYAAPAIRPSGSSSRPSSRSASSRSQQQQQLQQLQQHTPPLPQYPYAYPQPRYYTVPEQGGRSGSPLSRAPPQPRPLPDDPNWAPRARSTSNLVPYPPDQYAYQTYAPPGAQIDPRYAMQGRRHISGPPDVHYPSMRPPPPDIYGGSSSDPYLMTRRQYSNEDRNTENEDDEDDDEDNGMQVEVVERPSGYESRVASGGSRGGRQRKGRR
jgi:PRA1 family protein 1